MARRGISEKLTYVHNPLPALTEEELVAHTDLELLRTATRPFFTFEWKYSAGDENEFVQVKPGEFFPLRLTEAGEFLKQFTEMGAVRVDDPSDAEAVAKAADKGLQTAFKFWSDRGNKRIVEYRKTHGVNKDDLEDHKYDLWAYFRNQAAAEAIQAHIRDLRGKKAPASKSPKE